MKRWQRATMTAVASLAMAGCWGQRSDEGGAAKTADKCMREEPLTNRLLHKSQTLEAAVGRCYVVPEQVTVGTDVHLTIEPGVRVVFADGAGLTVHEGTLTARGTAENPIIFTAKRHSPGAWTGIRLMNPAGSDNAIEHAVIEYGGSTPGYKGVKPANLMIDDYYGEVVVSISDVTMRRSGGYGLYAEADVQSAFADNTLTENQLGAAYLDPVFVDQLDANSKFSGNQRDVVELAGARVDRRNLNWPGLKVPYVVTGDIDLKGGTLVEIGPGAVFKFAENTGISVFRSRLAARGKQGSPVVFTGLKKVPGFWRGIRYVDTNSVDNVLEHVAIRYGGASPTFKGVEPANLMLDDYYGEVRLKLNNTELSHSGRYGIYAEQKTKLEFSHNRLVANARAAGLVHPAVVDALDAQSTYGAAAVGQPRAGGGDDGQTDAGSTNGSTSDAGASPTTTNGMATLEVLGAPIAGAEITWPAIGAHYLVLGDVLVRDDAHLTVAPGARVAFAAGAGLSVFRARLTARGTAQKPIVFTGQHHKPGYWKGIHLVDTSSVENIFEHVTIEYGGAAKTFKGAEPANLMFDDYFGLVSATLQDVTIRNSGAAGMHIEWGAKIRSPKCSSIHIDDDTQVTKGGQSLSRACRG